MSRHARPGLQALRRPDARLIRNGGRATGSINLEAVTIELWQSTVKHWDYLLALDARTNSRALGVEVHSATSDSEAAVLTEKKRTAVRVLRQELPTLAVHGWYWLVSGSSSAVRPGSRLHRLLVESNIEGPQSSLDLAIASRPDR